MAMLSKDQLLHLFNRFSFLISQLDVKTRIVDAVMDKQEAVAVTTAIQEEIFEEMGIDPGFGIACLGKVHMVYESDRDLMIQFYKFIAREEMACDEAELGPDEFSERTHNQQKLQEEQLEMLNQMRQYHLDDQSAILDKLRLQLENANFENEASVLSSEQIQEIVRRRVSPLFTPKYNLSKYKGLLWRSNDPNAAQVCSLTTLVGDAVTCKVPFADSCPH